MRPPRPIEPGQVFGYLRVLEEVAPRRSGKAMHRRFRVERVCCGTRGEMFDGGVRRAALFSECLDCQLRATGGPAPIYDAEPEPCGIVSLDDLRRALDPTTLDDV